MKFKFYKPFLLLALFSVLINANAQEFDEAFLESLPDEVASDLLSRSDKKMSLEEAQYRRPSTFINKPEKISNRFGAQVFSMMQSTLMPINEPNLDSSYSLDFGDELELQLIGQKSSITKLSLKRDGSVNIPDIGKIFLAGLSLNDAINLIKAKINESFIGVEAFITLLNVRDIQVIVAGNIYNPGPYTLNGNSNVFHALSVSGGPSEYGSFRSIDLIRNNKKIESIDLYQTLIFANPTFKKRLRSGDMIFVNPVGNLVSVNNGVKRPGQYELIKGENLSSVILFGNGLNKFANAENIVLERILDGKIKQLPIVNISQFANITPMDGDTINITNYKFRNIEVIGAVLNPGSFLMNDGDNINDAIKKAGGFSNNAYPFGGIYENLYSKEVNLMASEELYQNFVNKLLTLSQQNPREDQSLSSLLELTSTFQNTELSGRVVVDFLDQAEGNKILVQDGDKISIPEFTNHIYVYGEVSSEGSARYIEGKSIEFYLNIKGGLTESADKKNIYILYPNGETNRLTKSKNLFVNQSKVIEIYPGSVIFVPRELDDSYSSRLKTQAYVSILSNLGISLASLSVLK